MTRIRMPRRQSWLRRFFALVPAVGLAGAVSWLAQAASAQEAAPAAENSVARTYLNKPLVHLPIEIDNSYRTQVNSLVLYMKEGATGNWSLRDKGNALQTSFTFRAPKDGEYWFRIVAVDNQGKAHPDDLNKDPQDSVVVVVDQVPPAVELVYHGAAPEGQIVQCEVRDTNPDMLKVRFFYQTRDGIWRTLDPLPNRPDVFCVPAQAALTNLLKVMATDLAGNSTQRSFNLGELAARASKTGTPLITNAPAPLPQAVAHGPQTPLMPQVTQPAPMMTPPAPMMPYTAQTTPVVTQPASMPTVTAAQAPAVAPELPTTQPPTTAMPDMPRDLPIAKELPFQPQQANAPIRSAKSPAPAIPSAGPSLEAIPSRTSQPAVQPETTTTTTTTDVQTVSAGNLSRQSSPQDMQLVNTTQVFLNYAFENVGASGVGKVEIWATRDQGQTWSKLAEDAQRKSPAEVRLPGEGLFGLKLVVSNGRGYGAQPPQAGDPSDWWIEVDTTKPKATLTGIRNGTAQEGGAVYVLWQADDKNLAAEPIELYFAPSREGPWTMIGKNIPNDGQYKWVPPAQAGSNTYLRLLVRDKAGNVALSESVQPIPLDDQSRPRIRLINVTTTPANLQTRSGSPTGPGMIVPVMATSTPASGSGLTQATYVTPGQ